MSKKLDRVREIQYRACVARCNYMCQDRSDVQYQVKELCRAMSSPTEADWLMLKRLARYLIGRTRVIVCFGYQEANGIIDVWTDTDYGGCQVSRKSASAGIVMLGGHMVKSSSSTQTNVALSSGVAEYYGFVKGASMAIGIRSMHEEMGIKLRIRVSTDASAAKGIASRRGLGKVRHIEFHQLWVQDKVSNGEIEIRKVDGKVNLADAEELKGTLLKEGCRIVAVRIVVVRLTATAAAAMVRLTAIVATAMRLATTIATMTRGLEEVRIMEVTVVMPTWTQRIQI